MTPKIAIIDCGTNTFNLLIAKQTDTGIKIYYEGEKSVRIGDQSRAKGLISERAMSKAVEVMKEFCDIMTDYRVDGENIHAFATSAFRNTKNGTQLRKKIADSTGVDIQIISGTQEAELIYHGVNQAIDIKDTVLIIDIGGGSVELILADSNAIIWKTSLEIGAQRLVNLFQPSEPITPAELIKIDQYLSNELSVLFSYLDKYKPNTLIGASGSFETFSDMYIAENHSENSVNSRELPFELSFYHQIHELLTTSNLNERSQIKGMSSIRVDMIVVASCIVHCILKHHNFTNFRISNYALKEGVIFQVFNEINKTN